jgi:putative hydrolase of the HAD superfamily
MPADLHRNVVGNFEESILHGPPRLLDGAADGVARLASFAALALISDTAFSPGRILARLLEEWGIRRHFRLLVFSDETGVSKPHRLAFDTALKGLDASPREAVHVGDIEWTDIRGAKDFGMRAILFRGDARSPFRSEGTPTAADAVAENWDETLRIIDAWRKGAPRAGEQVP